MKILKEKYPMGSFKGQKSDGRYIDGYLHDNLQFMAEKISKDMTFMGVIFSSTLEVGTGKTVLATQIGEAWTDIINKKYKKDIEFTQNNLIFNPKDLIKRSFEVPKHSFILLDEWEDASYWSELGVSLRQFFRKCRQLNLFMLIIIPNWFQFPMSYAISRSLFAIDVKFEEGLERGYFDFYDFESKKFLYIKGKKFHNYRVQRPTFQGRFTDGYGIPERAYREAKLKDMMEYDKHAPRKLTILEKNIRMQKKMEEGLKKLYPNLNVPTTYYAEIFGNSPQSINSWRRGDYVLPPTEEELIETSYSKLLNKKEVVWDEEAIEQSKNKEQ